jgi:hypothetical protein
MPPEEEDRQRGNTGAEAQSGGKQSHDDKPANHLEPWLAGDVDERGKSATQHEDRNPKRHKVRSSVHKTSFRANGKVRGLRLSQKRHDFINRSDVIRDPSFHCSRHPERLIHPSEVVTHEV